MHVDRSLDTVDRYGLQQCIEVGLGVIVLNVGD